MRGVFLAGLGLTLVLIAQQATHPALALASLGAAVVILATLVWLGTGRLLAYYRRRLVLPQLRAVVADDVIPVFFTTPDGQITGRNKVAGRRMPKAQTVAEAMQMSVAYPGPMLARLSDRARRDGLAHEEVVTRRGQIRVSAQDLGEEGLLWRLEDRSDTTPAARGGAGVPLITVGRAGAILSVNEAARRLLGARPRTLDRVFGDGAVQSGQIACIATAEGTRPCIIAEGDSTPARREIYLIPCAKDAAPPRAAVQADMLPVALLWLDNRGHVNRANPAARAMLRNDSCEGLPLSSLVEGLGRSISDWLADAQDGRAALKAEFLRLSNCETETFLQVSLHRLSGAAQSGLVAVLQDATEFKTLEAQFVQSQKMQAVGELAGGVAHDFNNLLTAISGHCDLLLLRHDPGDPDYSDLVQISQNANRAAALVSQLLAFSRKQTLRPQTLDLRDTLSDLTHLLNRLVGEKITLTLMHDPSLAPIRADKRQLEQVIMNLVVNARDAMPEGGEIRVETSRLDLAQPLERDRATVPVGSYAMVRVIDEGCGIPEPVRSKVFEPFFTTKPLGQGTGLGLSTVYGIVKQSGGYVFVDSAEGQGTTFELYFPAHKIDPATEDAAEAAGPDTAERKPRSAAPATGVVLLVEDEAPVRAFAARALRLRGYQVIEAASAEEALEVLEDAALQIDIFVTDVVMPGLDGPSWVRKALQDRPGVQVVFVSGYAEESFSEAQHTQVRQLIA